MVASTTADIQEAARVDGNRLRPARTPAGREAFYAELVSRNDGFIPAELQECLRRATILVAGCGSVGGSVVELLARMGAERFILADPEDYELSNGNRQHAYLDDVGHNKAACFRRKILAINPWAEVHVESAGITAGNVAGLVVAADAVVDGVEVVVEAARTAKCLLHLEAFRRRKPVVAGADVAMAAMVRCYDYRRPGARYYNGLIREDQIGRITTTQFMTRDIPLWLYPVEMFGEVEKLLAGKPHFSQLGPTAQMLGAMMAQAVVGLLDGQPVRELVRVDLPTLFRPRGRRATVWLSWVRTVLRCLRLFLRVRRLGEDALPGWKIGGNTGRSESPTAALDTWRRTAVGACDAPEGR